MLVLSCQDESGNYLCEGTLVTPVNLWHSIVAAYSTYFCVPFDSISAGADGCIYTSAGVRFARGGEFAMTALMKLGCYTVRTHTPELPTVREDSEHIPGRLMQLASRLN